MRRNVDLGTFQAVVRTALGGMTLAQSVEGRERYDILLRYDRPFRETTDDLEDILVPAPTGAHIPLGELASISFAEGPPMIRSENARLAGWVFVDIEGRDVGSYVSEARRVVDETVALPPGYAIEWSGQYEQMARASARLDVMRRIALPMLGGMASTTVLTLLVVPVVYGLWVGRGMQGGERAGSEPLWRDRAAC